MHPDLVSKGSCQNPLKKYLIQLTHVLQCDLSELFQKMVRREQTNARCHLCRI